MDELLRFLAAIETWVYLVIGFLGFIFLIRLGKAWKEWHAAIFGLERDTAQRKFSAAMTVLVLLAILGLAEFLLVTLVMPSYPMAQVLATPTINMNATRTMPARTAEMTPTGLISTLVVTGTGGCIPGVLEWTSPKSGGQIKGSVTLKGTVNVNNLGFYKYEYSQGNSNNWITIAAGNQKRIDGELGGAWNTGQLIPGDYKLRLVVADNQNQTLPACVISIRITSP